MAGRPTCCPPHVASLRPVPAPLRSEPATGSRGCNAIEFDSEITLCGKLLKTQGKFRGLVFGTISAALGRGGLLTVSRLALNLVQLIKRSEAVASPHQNLGHRISNGRAVVRFRDEGVTTCLTRNASLWGERDGRSARSR